MVKEKGINKKSIRKSLYRSEKKICQFLRSSLAGTSIGTAAQEESATLPPTLVTVE